MKKLTKLLPALCAAIVLAACTNSYNADDSNTKPHGTVELTLSAVSPWLAPYIRGNEPSSRAFLYADKVTIDIYTQNGIPVLPTIEQTIDSNVNNGIATISIEQIPSGTNYFLVVNLWNSNADEFSPQVGAWVSNVNITDNQTTQVQAVCQPLQPTAISPNQINEKSLTAHSEAWYVFYAPTDISVTIYQYNQNLQAYIFDNSGELVGIADNGNGFTFNASAFNSYYVGVAGIESAQTSSIYLEADLTDVQEGSAEAPIELTINDTNRIFTVGNYYMYSYYKFTTNEAGIYKFVSDTSVPFVAVLYTDSSFYNYITYAEGTSTLSFPILSANTTYYMILANNYQNSLVFTGGITGPHVFSALPLAVDSGWVQGTLDSDNAEVWYEVTVPASGTYLINWDDSFSGSGTYNGDLMVSAFSEDYSQVYFTNVDSAYNSTEYVTVAPGASKFYIKVLPYANSTYHYGNYAIKVTSEGAQGSGSLNLNVR
jgi:hypothetical protein